MALIIGIGILCWMWYGLGRHHGYQDGIRDAKKQNEKKEN